MRTMSNATGAYTAHDLRTVSFVPLRPYRLGWEDARYQRVYHNPFPVGTADYLQYDSGHRAGTMSAKRDAELTGAT